MSTTTQQLQNFIGGKSVPTSGDGVHEVRNAATGEVIAEMGISSQADVDAAVASRSRRLPRVGSGDALRAQPRPAEDRR